MRVVCFCWVFCFVVVLFFCVTMALYAHVNCYIKVFKNIIPLPHAGCDGMQHDGKLTALHVGQSWMPT